MRTSTAFFYAIVLFGVTFMLYFMLELTGISTSGGKANGRSTSVSPEEEREVDTLERKLSHLEATILKNQKLLVSLQANLSSLLIHQVPLLQDNLLVERKKIKAGGSLMDKTTISDVNLAERTTGVAEVGGHQTAAVSRKIASPDGTEQCPAMDLMPAQTNVQMLKMYDHIPFDNADGGVWKQGWELSYDPVQWTFEQPLQVFIVPHSHNDPGWLRTFEEYFEEQTKHIFNLMIKKLPANPRRKIIWAEISYLSLWWTTATEESKATFKKLLKDGQVELVTGGWVMPDEANSHYSAMINQLVEGHEWIKNHIGGHSLPKHGWSIDPFGLSPTMAYILKLHKFDAMLIQRAHYSVKKELGKTKSLEFQWRQAWDSTGRTDMLCHLMPFYSYDVPHTCGPDPKICCQFDFKRLPGGGGAKSLTCPWGIPPRPITSGNMKERAETLLDQYRKKAQLTQTNVVLAPLGDDFRYDTASEWDRQFINYEKLIRYYSSRPDLNVRIQFGTLKDYFEALKKDTLDRAITWPTLSGDFFTYADRDDHYWSGYFTSRPFYKSLVRKLEARLRSAEIAYSMALGRYQRNLSGPTFQSVDLLLVKLVSSRRSLALFQHHDGITGTAKTAVMADYAIKMIHALTSCDDVLGSSLTFLLQPDEKSALPFISLESEERFETHDKPPIKKRLQVSLGNGRRVIVYNSLAQSREERVTVRVDVVTVSVEEETSGQVLLSQINPVWMGKTDRISVEEFEVVFFASIPALGVKSYLIKPLAGAPSGNVHNAGRMNDIKGISVSASVELFSDWKRPVETAGNLFNVKSDTYPPDIVVGNDLFTVSFDGKTGYIKNMKQKHSKTAMNVALKFVQYGTTDQPDKSGAYLFLPDGPAKDILIDGIFTEHKDGIPVYASPLIRVMRGPVVSEVHLVLPQLIHIVRVIHSIGLEGQAPEIINYVDITGTNNYELAMHLTTGINNEDFVTDLNGFQLIRRKTLAKLPLQANYYPMPAVAFLEDDDHRLTLLAEQPLGVASLEKGTLEVMQDRRLDQDDNRGLGQPVHDNVPLTRSTFRLFLESNRPSSGSSSFRSSQSHPVLSLLSQLSLQSLSNPYVLLFDPTPQESPPSIRIQDLPGLPQDLPCDVHLLNLRTAVAQESDQGVASAFSGSDATGGATALMLLHRVGVDCRRQSTMSKLKCQPLKGKLDLKSSFARVFSLPFVEEGSPSPLAGRGALLPVDATVTLDVMHVHSFRFPLV